MSLRAKDTSQVKRPRVFTVVGPHDVFGKHKGEVVEVELTDSQADALIIGGHVVEKSVTKSSEVAAPWEKAPSRGDQEVSTGTDSMTVTKIPGDSSNSQDTKKDL